MCHPPRRPDETIFTRSERGQPRSQLTRPALNAAEFGARGGTAINQNGGYRASLCGGEARISNTLKKERVYTVVITEFGVESHDKH